ncbi:MAG: DUF3592 domain-containing protein [Ruminococcus sp.]|nr:DUF3592 domain-containing protein [Ruminococcus sp.]
MKIKKVGSMSIVLVVFLLVGLVLSVIGIVQFKQHIDFNKTMPETEAIITEIKSHRSYSNGKSKKYHDVYISYRTEDGDKEKAKLNYYTSSMNEGDVVKIHYNPDRPGEIKTKKYTTEIVMVLIGVVFTALGVGFTVGAVKKSNRKKFLKKEGIVSQALITGYDFDTSLEVNGNNPLMLICEIKDEYTGAVHRYYSESSFDDLTLYINSYVTVYVNPSDPDEGYVDLDSLTENVQLKEGI